jgi:putative DNA methylase
MKMRKSVPEVLQGTATKLSWPDNFLDAVLTDPPYYDNVNYSALSDFFYVWLKRTVGDLYPDLFATPLTPKSEEIVQDPNRQNRREAARAFFEQRLTQAFREIHRVLKPDGIAVIVFAHKTTEPGKRSSTPC